jgi:hypothetical protein
MFKNVKNLVEMAHDNFITGYGPTTDIMDKSIGMDPKLFYTKENIDHVANWTSANYAFNLLFQDLFTAEEKEPTFMWYKEFKKGKPWLRIEQRNTYNVHNYTWLCSLFGKKIVCVARVVSERNGEVRPVFMYFWYENIYIEIDTTDGLMMVREADKVTDYRRKLVESGKPDEISQLEQLLTKATYYYRIGDTESLMFLGKSNDPEKCFPNIFSKLYELREGGMLMTIGSLKYTTDHCGLLEIAGEKVPFRFDASATGGSDAFEIIWNGYHIWIHSRNTDLHIEEAQEKELETFKIYEEAVSKMIY